MDGTRKELRKNRVGQMPEREDGGSHRSFLSGVGTLTVATLLSKVIGLFYRIPLLSIVGIGGMISNGIIGVVIDAFTAIFSGSVQLGYSAGYLLNVLFSVLTVLTALCLMHRFAKEKKKC